eukprot:1218980-Pyramimonas_sp.AAC.1
MRQQRPACVRLEKPIGTDTAAPQTSPGPRSDHQKFEANPAAAARASQEAQKGGAEARAAVSA